MAITKTMSALQEDIHQISVSKGFYENPRRIGEQIALMHSELSEALEEHRDGVDLAEVYYSESVNNEVLSKLGKLSINQDVFQETHYQLNGHDVPKATLDEHGVFNRKPEGFAVELADCVIRILDTCEFLGIDLQPVIEEKMAYNATRPHKHGRVNL